MFIQTLKRKGTVALFGLLAVLSLPGYAAVGGPGGGGTTFTTTTTNSTDGSLAIVFCNALPIASLNDSACCGTSSHSMPSASKATGKHEHKGEVPEVTTHLPNERD